MNWLKTVARTREVLANVVCGLNSHASASVIERDAVTTLCRLPNIRNVISGYHRSAGSGSLVVENGDPYGSVIVLLNTLDGHENYERGSRLYGASLVVWEPHSRVLSFVYNGMTGTIREISTHTKQVLNVREPRRIVIAMGRHVNLSKRSASIAAEGSVRWYGSTTLAILGVADGHIDLAINRTKPWNLWWAAPLCMQGSVVIKGFAELNTFINANPKSVASMTSSIDMVCLRPELSRKAWQRLLAAEYAKSVALIRKS